MLFWGNGGMHCKGLAKAGRIAKTLQIEMLGGFP